MRLIEYLSTVARQAVFITTLFGVYVFQVPDADAQAVLEDLTRFVNPLIGTDSEFALSNGNSVFPIKLGFYSGWK